MPTYEYECVACGEKFEVFQKMTDPLLEGCPKCEGRLRRLIGSGSGLIFKGPGFYATDYRSESYRAKEKEDRKKEPPGTRGAKEGQPGGKISSKEDSQSRSAGEEDE